MPVAAGAQSSPYRISGDALWTTTSIGVMSTAQRGDTVWHGLIKPNKTPVFTRYVVRGTFAYTIDGKEMKVPAIVLPRRADADKWRQVDSLQRAELRRPQ